MPDARLSFLVVKQNGVSGLMWLTALPDRDQAAAIIEVLSIERARAAPPRKASDRLAGADWP